MLKKLLLTAFVLLLSVQVFAQEEGTHFSYGNLNLTLDSNLPQNVNIYHFPADPLEVGYPGGPQPAHLEIMFYDGSTAPQYAWETNANIFIYQTADMVGYDLPLAELTMLQTILAERPDLSARQNTNSAFLPWLPVANAMQVMVAQAKYIDLCGLSGVSYLSYYSQAVNPILATDIFYTFQGLSADGQTYISVGFRPAASVFPSEMPADFDYAAFEGDYMNYLATSLATLDAAAPETFSPSLTALDSVIGSLNLGNPISECF